MKQRFKVLNKFNQLLYLDVQKLKVSRIGHHTILGSWKSSSAVLKSNRLLNSGWLSLYCWKAANAYDRLFCGKINKIAGIIEARGRSSIRNRITAQF